MLNPEYQLQRYEFDFDTLQDLTFEDNEQYASASATWFVTGGQLTYRDAELDPLINVSQSPPPENSPWYD